MRKCGTCTWCCYFLDVPEYDSTTGVYCKHCEIDKGCSIYKNREDVCQKFECLWLMDENIPDRLRPDRCGVMFELPFESNVMIGYSDPAVQESHEEQDVLILVRKLTMAGYPVVFINGKERHTFLPAGWTFDGVKQDLLNTYERHYK